MTNPRNSHARGFTTQPFPPFGFAFALSCTVVLGGLSGCGGKTPMPTAGKQGPPPAPVDIAVVPSIAHADVVTVAARLHSPAMVELRSRVAGQLERLTFSDGAEISAGTTLAEIDPRPLRALRDRATAQVTAAEAMVALSGNDQERTSRLRAADATAVTTEELDRKRAALDSARAELAGAQAAQRQAELDLGFSTITAPITGRISRANIDAGNLVAVGQPVIATIISQDPLEIACYITEDQGSKLIEFTRSASVALAVQVGNDSATRSATVIYIAPAIDPASGTIEVRARMDNGDRRYRPGAFARVTLPLTPIRQVAIIDEHAVINSNKGHAVLLMVSATQAVPHPVRLGEHLPGGLRVVESGLEPGQQIILQPTMVRMYIAGFTVAPHEVAMDPAARTVVEVAAGAH